MATIRLRLGTLAGILLVAAAVAVLCGCSTTHARTDGEAANRAPAATLDGASLAPDAAAAWQRLLAGNVRFVAGRPEHAGQSGQRRMEVAKGQHPFAIVLACSDSRVPPEILFDAGLGDLFVIRVAGNTADNAALGSLEYAVEHLHVPLIVVLGHERCGAVDAAVSAARSREPVEGHLNAIIDPILPAVKAVADRGGDVVENAVRENVRRVVEQLSTCQPVLAESVHERKLSIIGCRYDLQSGRVTVVNRSGRGTVPGRTAQ